MDKQRHCRIVRMHKEDIGALLEIENYSFPTPWTHAMFLQELSNPRSKILLLKNDEEHYDSVKGYICFWEVVDELHILNLAVRSSCRRQGVASTLLAVALHYGVQRNLYKAMLEVRERNYAAQRLYTRVGFRQVGIRKGYYQDTGEHALLLELKLDEYKSDPRFFSSPQQYG
ncbi:MAG TPA: ribosomal protein S18-alanine N-acetyltransferase [Thermodesulfobacteriota bacterium]|nr:ribosomal protein S18-alanine N-acetyltransferase [Deltaproteobacteria bacterium]HNR12472.1 ribosomal protein S18-alanine N-acetyltransferase [Thermodesulfobacteriota bacterium]HNU71195.1 ribosomal protein S18-alanine N-acetyltransferase [Thermodesulfobacteriota bacterium]HOC38566.1 ribosomal protein S18-alanine N-acetyltransferase [Thermodesulfobacteriota bacterium]HQO77265.1 ribosomal protein S18-alanine N-acetyltransferase [Thermodesulfobacteriota bacterium]